MLFNSKEFLFFLPIVFVLYWLLGRRRKAQNLFILFASYVFYGWWSWKFLLLIAFTSFSSFICGILIDETDGKRKRKAYNTANIVVNIGILAVYKYYGFFSENLAIAVKSLFGYNLDWITVNLILPVGISFYTFQALSYTIDVYQQRIKATRDPIEFFAFLSFFPQLVAGPIERATNLLPQFQKSRTFDYAQSIDGLRQMLWGFFKKVVVADLCAVNVDAVWSNYANYSSLLLIVILVLFSIQMYCDFSGYSDIAIGCAKLFGIRLTKNFDFPYFSRNISEFWRKWHISLMTWFRDYVYIPMGGSRCSKVKLIRNIFVVFLLSGIWHKANWTYIFWGLYHASLISIIVIFNIKTKYKQGVAEGRTLPSLKEFGLMLFTFTLVVFSRLFSRSDSINEAFGYLNGIFITGAGLDYQFKNIAILVIGIVLMFVVEWLQRGKQHALESIETHRMFKHPMVRWGGVLFPALSDMDFHQRHHQFHLFPVLGYGKVCEAYHHILHTHTLRSVLM